LLDFRFQLAGIVGSGHYRRALSLICDQPAAPHHPDARPRFLALAGHLKLGQSQFIAHEHGYLLGEQLDKLPGGTLPGAVLPAPFS
jgi:hypothetical protein